MNTFCTISTSRNIFLTYSLNLLFQALLAIKQWGFHIFYVWL